jgi:ABC-type nitrate/sulfonate/bicarbonate transport system ATPase subunit
MYGSRTLRVQDDGGEGGPSLGAGTECAGLEIKNANFTYEGSDSPVFRDFNITLSRTKPVLLRGKNGIGKSTLLRLLAGLEEWDVATRDAINGASPEINSAAPASVFFIPQDLELPPRRLLTDLLASHEGKPARLIEEFAEVAGTEPLLKKTGLSGGERSRIALLWALASDDTTVLLDEPMAAIALADREKILLKFLDVAARQGKRVIMSSHDPFSATAEAMFDIVEMERAKG